MSTYVLRTAWMEPATLYRAQERRSELLGRRVLGEKGVGRFAASRLADRLVVITRRPDADHETFAYFDWTQFDDPDLYLADVDVLWDEQTPTELTANGALAALLLPDDELPTCGRRSRARDGPSHGGASD